jgi:hypothetical protein
MIASLEEAAEEVSWTDWSQRDEIRRLEGIIDSKIISRMEESIDWERSHNCTMLREENCHLSSEVGRLQAQINDSMRASRPGMESKMEYPPCKESTYCAACVGITAGVDDYLSDDNLSLFSSSDDDGSN